MHDKKFGVSLLSLKVGEQNSCGNEMTGVNDGGTGLQRTDVTCLATPS